MPNYRQGLGDDTERYVFDTYGYLEYRHAPGDTCEIVNIEVQEVHRGEGIGTSLLARLENDPNIRVIYAFTQESNELAQKWYVKNGFKLTLIENFYPTDDAFLCIKRIR